MSSETRSDHKRIIIVTGSRAFEVCRRSRFWGRRAMARELSSRSPDIVAHGAAKGWDTYCDEFAEWAGIARAAFPLAGRGAPERCPELWLPNGARRPLKNADRYAYSAPLPRNEAMMRWGADHCEAGHSVTVVACVAPWSSSGGTQHAIDRARAFELKVDLIVVPSDVWPEEDPAVEGQHGA